MTAVVTPEHVTRQTPLKVGATEASPGRIDASGVNTVCCLLLKVLHKD